MTDGHPAAALYSILGVLAVALLLAGLSGDTSDTGSGIGMAIFGGLFLSASVSGLLGALAGSRGHVAWALTGFFIPGYSLPFLLYSGLKGWEERKRAEAARTERRDEERLQKHAAAEQRDPAAPLAELAERLGRLNARYPEAFKLPACESARRFLAEYEASGPTAEAAALAEQAARETSEALAALTADVPDVSHRDSRGERWAPRPRLLDSRSPQHRERHR